MGCVRRPIDEVEVRCAAAVAQRVGEPRAVEVDLTALDALGAEDGDVAPAPRQVDDAKDPSEPAAVEHRRDRSARDPDTGTAGRMWERMRRRLGDRVPQEATAAAEGAGLELRNGEVAARIDVEVILRRQAVCLPARNPVGDDGPLEPAWNRAGGRARVGDVASGKRDLCDAGSRGLSECPQRHCRAWSEVADDQRALAADMGEGVLVDGDAPENGG